MASTATENADSRRQDRDWWQKLYRLPHRYRSLARAGFPGAMTSGAALVISCKFLQRRC